MRASHACIGTSRAGIGEGKRGAPGTLDFAARRKACRSLKRATLLATTVKRDYYEVLGVARTANDQEIKSAYRKLALQYHPDRNPGNAEAEERFKECSEAYAVLADSEKRARYDRFGHAGVGAAAGQGFGGFDATVFNDFQDIFGDIFGFGDLFGGQPGRRRSRAQRGADLREDLSIQFEEAVFGVTRQMQVRRHEECDQCKGSGIAPGRSPITCTTCGGHGQMRYQQGFFSISRSCGTCGGTGKLIVDPCNQCRGQGRIVRERTVTVKVPAGIEEGARILYSGEGEAGVYGGSPGDLYVVLHVSEHAFFERDGKNLHCVVPISFSQAALGAELQVPTLEGMETLKIPEGTQSGANFRLKHKGVPVLNGRGRGDLIVQVRVQTPSKLSKRQRELLEELHGTLSVENKPVSRSLLSRMKEIFG
ncbi:MAG TPA: molecular chaperone DnaJ [Candidatus Binatia bacterium]|nr:molecular chaperone DnaJ [Candidatus Binatia bacterium]